MYATTEMSSLRLFDRQRPAWRSCAKRWVLGLAVAVSLWGCGSVGPKLNVSNGTALAVSVFVNGVRVGDFLPGKDTADTSLAALPPLPWIVEARTPSGRSLVSMRVEAQDLAPASGLNGKTVQSGVVGRIDLSCGRLTIWVGDIAPSGPMPPESPGEPGDCDP